MCNVAELERMRRQSFIFGELAFTGSWVLFVAALLGAGLLPESVIKSSTIIVFYSLLCTVLWSFYIITHLGCSFMGRFPEQKAWQWGGLLVVCAALGAAFYYCALIVPLILIAVPIALLSKRCWKCVGLNIVAGIGEFMALANTVLLALLLKALLLADWELSGVGLRCDVMMYLCGAGGVAGILARAALLGGKDWTLKDMFKRKSVIAMWLVVVIAFIGTVAANSYQERQLARLKAEAEKLFGRELSADGLEKAYLNGGKPDDGFYAGLAAVNSQLNKKLRSPELRKLFKQRKAGKNVDKEWKLLMDKLQAGAAEDYALLDRYLSVDVLPKAQLAVADGKLAEAKYAHLATLRRTAHTVLGRMRFDVANAVKYSEQFFKVLTAMDGVSAMNIAARSKLCERWQMTVQKLAADKKLTDEQFKKVKAIAQSYADKIDVDESLRNLIYQEAVFAYDLYRANSLTTVNATGAYFRSDRAAALRSLMDAYRKNGADYQKPGRGIARITAAPLEVLRSSLQQIKDVAKEL